MASQASLNDREQNGDVGSATAVVGNAADVVSDVAELAELQGKLLAVDIKAASRRTLISLGLLAVGLCVLLGIVPVLLFAVAELFEARADLSPAVALLASAGCGAAFCIASFVVAALLLWSGIAELETSLHELKRNLRWIKRSLRTAGR